MERMTRVSVFRWSGVEADAHQRYTQYREYRRGRQDGRLGHLRAGLSPAYLLGFELGRRDADHCRPDRRKPT